MELELGLAPPNTHHLVERLGELSSTAVSACGKRGFREAFEKETATTLPLFDDGSSSNKRRKPLVGWPPVSSARRACGANHVKVKKEGVAIGRKVDMSLHASYDELLATLGRMFPATNNKDQETSNVVTYEDGDGDWMLVGDVPWDDFARSVKRLKILGQPKETRELIEVEHNSVLVAGCVSSEFGCTDVHVFDQDFRMGALGRQC